MSGPADKVSSRSTTRREHVAFVGVAAVACAACCAGPVLGVLAAVGLGTALGAALWGVGAVVVGVLMAVLVVRRRRASARRGCDAGGVDGPVPVVLAPPSARSTP
jgi:hypothetical protein